MSSLKLVMLRFSILMFLGTSAALICKECNVHCEDSVDELCLEPGESQEVACLTETFKDSDNRTLHQKKCVLYKKDTKFECADYPQYDPISCVTCKTDRCNGASSGADSRKPLNETIITNSTNTNNNTRV